MSDNKPPETLFTVMSRIAADRDMTTTDLAKVLGNTYQIFWRKCVEERFTIGQIKYLQEKIFLTPSEIYDIINVSTPKDASRPGNKAGGIASGKAKRAKKIQSE